MLGSCPWMVASSYCICRSYTGNSEYRNRFQVPIAGSLGHGNNTDVVVHSDLCCHCRQLYVATPLGSSSPDLETVIAALLAILSGIAGSQRTL